MAHCAMLIIATAGQRTANPTHSDCANGNVGVRSCPSQPTYVYKGAAPARTMSRVRLFATAHVGTTTSHLEIRCCMVLPFARVVLCSPALLTCFCSPASAHLLCRPPAIPLLALLPWGPRSGRFIRPNPARIYDGASVRDVH